MVGVVSFVVILAGCQSSEAPREASPKPLPPLIVQEQDHLYQAKPKANGPALHSRAEGDSSLSAADQKAIIQFLSELYGLNEYQGFMFNDLEFLLPHCSEALLQKMQIDDEEGGGYSLEGFRTPAEDGSSINSLLGVEYKQAKTFVLKYIDRGHTATTEIDATIVFGKVWLSDVRLVDWSEEVME